MRQARQPARQDQHRPDVAHPPMPLPPAERSVRSGTSGQLAQKPLDPDQRLLEFRQCRRIAAPHMPFARCTEDISWNHGNALGVEELFGEFLGGQTGAANRRERVERPAGLRAVQANLAEALDKDAAAAVIVGNHFVRVGFAGAQCLQRGQLRYM